MTAVDTEPRGGGDAQGGAGAPPHAVYVQVLAVLSTYVIVRREEGEGVEFTSLYYLKKKKLNKKFKLRKKGLRRECVKILGEREGKK